MIGQIREAVRLIRAGEPAVICGSVFGLHVEVTLRPHAPVPADRCSCGHANSDHTYGSCWICDCGRSGS